MTDPKSTPVYTVSFWGSHPDAKNDDCWTGEDFTDLPAALAAFLAECKDRDVAFVMLDGPSVNQIRQHPGHRPRKKPAADYELERSERAMQAGMAFGCDGYNDEMGF